MCDQWCSYFESLRKLHNTLCLHQRSLQFYTLFEKDLIDNIYNANSYNKIFIKKVLKTDKNITLKN